jgi:hypothetical protein
MTADRLWPGLGVDTAREVIAAFRQCPRFAALHQLAPLAEFRTELPEVTARKRGLPEVDIQIGIVPGDEWWTASARSTPSTTRVPAMR